MVTTKLFFHFLTVVLLYSSTCIASGWYTLLTKDGIKQCKKEYSQKTVEQLDDIIKSEYTVLESTEL